MKLLLLFLLLSCQRTLEEKAVSCQKAQVKIDQKIADLEKEKQKKRKKLDEETLAFVEKKLMEFQKNSQNRKLCLSSDFFIKERELLLKIQTKELSPKVQKLFDEILSLITSLKESN